MAYPTSGPGVTGNPYQKVSSVQGLVNPKYQQRPSSHSIPVAQQAIFHAPVAVAQNPTARPQRVPVGGGHFSSPAVTQQPGQPVKK